MFTRQQEQLSALQQRVFDVLQAKPNKDVPIEDLYYTAYPISGAVHWTLSVRDMQQRMGPLFVRINDKLKRGRIVPGELKQTYRLDTKHQV